MRSLSKILFLSALVVGVGLVPGTARPAQADIVLEFVGVSVSPVDPSHFRWTYNVNVGPISRVNAPGDGITGPAAPSPGAPNPGDFATLYDFRGFTGVAGVVGPIAGSWSVTSQLVGFTPGVGADGHFPTQSPPDSASIDNISFRKTSGPAILGPSPMPIGQIFADSLFSAVGVGVYTSADHVHDPGNLLDNTSQSRTSSVLTTAMPSATPEPGTMLLFGLAAPGALALLRKKKTPAV